METRLISRVGTRLMLRKEWGRCPDPADGWGEEHVARVVENVPHGDEDKPAFPDADHPGYGRATNCERCGEEAPEDAERFAASGPLYDTPSGLPEPGSLYFVPHDPEERCWFGWENCDGSHLVCVLPNGRHWHISQRASNCGRPDDRTHRCWVRHGDPRRGEPVHVDKAGNTCSAGAGSILAGDYHGFLHHGRLTTA